MKPDDYLPQNHLKTCASRLPFDPLEPSLMMKWYLWLIITFSQSTLLDYPSITYGLSLWSERDETLLSFGEKSFIAWRCAWQWLRGSPRSVSFAPLTESQECLLVVSVTIESTKASLVVLKVGFLTSVLTDEVDLTRMRRILRINNLLLSWLALQMGSSRGVGARDPWCARRCHSAFLWCRWEPHLREGAYLPHRLSPLFHRVLESQYPCCPQKSTDPPPLLWNQWSVSGERFLISVSRGVKDS